jgi:hypothetical protein
MRPKTSLFLLWVAVHMVACGGTQRGLVVEPTVPNTLAGRPETAPLPTDPAQEEVPLIYRGSPESVVPLEAHAPAPYAGLLSTESRAWRDAQFRIRYRELRGIFEADRALTGVQRELYEFRLNAANERIRSLQPSWLSQHGLELGIGLGLVLGIGLSFGMYEIARHSP